MVRVTKLVHATLLVETTNRTTRVLIDPSAMFPLAADGMDGIDAILFTHRHADHFDPHLAGRFDGPVYGPASLIETLDRSRPAHRLGAGDRARIGDLAIAVHGARHEPSHPDFPPVDNLSYLFDDQVLVTGDALPLVACRTLLAPVDAPWLTVPRLLTYLRELRPERFLGVHDGLLSNQGLQVVDDVLRLETEHVHLERRRLADNQPVEA